MNALGRIEARLGGEGCGLSTRSPRSDELEAVETPVRLLSLDALRGFVMLALASGGCGLTMLARRFPGDPIWHFLAGQCKHAPWLGCSFSDLLQPLFLFIGGAALSLAQANRHRQGQSERRIVGQAVRRASLFVVLGVLFEINKSGGIAISFTNVLAQIGLGYVFVALLARRPFHVQLLAVAVILFGTWLAFALYPLPENTLAGGRDCTNASATNLANGRLPGFFARWNKHDNIAAAFDRRFLNLFPRAQPFVRHTGGYQTLNFIPSMATMLLGVMAGRLLLGARTPSRKLFLLAVSGLLCWGSGLILSWTICPCIKRLWTPSWVLVSGGGAFLTLAAFYGFIDVRGHRRWCLPLAGIGRKTLVLYSVSGLVQCLIPLLPRTVPRSLAILMWESTTLAILYKLIIVYGPLVFTVTLVLLLWRMGGRSQRREPSVPQPVDKRDGNPLLALRVRV